MDYALSSDEAALVEAVQEIVRDHADLSQEARRGFAHFDASLQGALQKGGFLDAARELGAVAGALVAMEVSRAPGVTDVGASALVAPFVARGADLTGPIALVFANDKAQRNLPVAKTALIAEGDDVFVVPLAGVDIAPVESVYAYPYGRFINAPEDRRGQKLAGVSVALRQWSRVALAAEMTGAAESAIALTLAHVKERRVFGKTVGAFQAVQHRLAQCHQAAMAMRYLTLKAAWAGDAYHAALAASFAQQKVQKLVFDLHQFNGAMGVTNAHLLHFWTYRLRALQAEAGGVHGASLDVARALWGGEDVVGA